MLKWGVVWDKNKNRPYFEGHERQDNVEHRKRFCERFLDKKDLYFYPLADEQRLNTPIREPIILLAHDESTFRSGDVQASRWFLPGSEPFHNKGRGRSIMVSDFLVQHDDSLFDLNPDEYERALLEYPELNDNDESINYFGLSASAWIHPQKDCYFNNSTILQQFERLFKLLKYKNDYTGHQIQILVDNATSHSKRVHDVQMFSKKAGTHCPYETIEWMEDEIQRTVQCKDSDGFYVGLLRILKELNLVEHDATEKDYKLAAIRDLLAGHVAFEPMSKLEKTAMKYGVKIIFCPKYHCELNPIEGLWCEQKRMVRKLNDQDPKKLKQLIEQSRNEFRASEKNIYLWRRFWKCLKLYSSGGTYQEVLQSFFGVKSSATVKSKTIAYYNILICYLLRQTMLYWRSSG